MSLVAFSLFAQQKALLSVAMFNSSMGAGQRVGLTYRRQHKKVLVAPGREQSVLGWLGRRN